jgi:hypothetical protein
MGVKNKPVEKSRFLSFVNELAGPPEHPELQSVLKVTGIKTVQELREKFTKLMKYNSR